jgi:hypothetical protein
MVTANINLVIVQFSTAAPVGMGGSIEWARAVSTPTYFWKVPDKLDYERSYDNKYDHFYPAWNGHGRYSQMIRCDWAS